MIRTKQSKQTHTTLFNRRLADFPPDHFKATSVIYSSSRTDIDDQMLTKIRSPSFKDHLNRLKSGF